MARLRYRLKAETHNIDTGPIQGRKETMGKSMKLGGGGRFEKLESKLENKGIKNPAGLAAGLKAAAKLPSMKKA